MEILREQLAPGVFLSAVHTHKFKSSTLSVTLLTPLERERASVNALVPYVLRRGCEELPTMEAVSARLEDLYGGMLEPVVRKKGETQGVGLLGSFLDDAYTLDGESVLEPAGELLAQLLLRPVTENGVFRAGPVSGEKDNLIQELKAQMNDKRLYAVHRLVQEMCAGEAYGVDRLGDAASMAAISPESLWEAYKALLCHAQVEVHYCGSAPVERLKGALKPLLEGLSPIRKDTVSLTCHVVPDPGHAPKTVVERMDVTQGKLCMGFRTNGVSALEGNSPALQVFNALYGGTATSKLFLNVREKLSLCYYAGCSTDFLKGLSVVSSGVEFDKMDRAQEEILSQLEAVRAGGFTDQELESARQAVINAHRSILDSRPQLEQFCLTSAVTGNWEDGPTEMAEKAEKVTAQEVVQIAKGLSLDTVYCLMGKEEGHD